MGRRKIQQCDECINGVREYVVQFIESKDAYKLIKFYAINVEVKYT
jgi:hypothetical protein